MTDLWWALRARVSHACGDVPSLLPVHALGNYKPNPHITWSSSLVCNWTKHQSSSRTPWSHGLHVTRSFIAMVLYLFALVTLTPGGWGGRKLHLGAFVCLCLRVTQKLLLRLTRYVYTRRSIIAARSSFKFWNQEIIEGFFTIVR